MRGILNEALILHFIDFSNSIDRRRVWKGVVLLGDKWNETTNPFLINGSSPRRTGGGEQMMDGWMNILRMAFGVCATLGSDD